MEKPELIKLLEEADRVIWAAQPSCDDYKGYYFEITADNRALMVTAVSEALEYLRKKEQTHKNERGHANAPTIESPGSCSPRVQKERIKDDVD